MDGEKFTNTSITIKGLLGLIEQRILLFLRFSDLLYGRRAKCATLLIRFIVNNIKSRLLRMVTL